MRKLLPLLLVLLFSCQSEPRSKDPFQGLVLKTPTGQSVETRLVYTLADQMQGLSGVKPEDFRDDQGMLFWYLEEDEKNFWMPDTYFDLDIIYLDREFRITDIVRKLPHYIGRAHRDLIPRARPVWSRHAVEMKAGSPISSAFKIGDKLEWNGKMTLQEAEVFINKDMIGKN
jgi:uncharacterized membrane protein (UPF0127 family)